MSVSIPFLKSDTNYTLICPIDDQTYKFDVHWNSRDKAFYFNMYQDNDFPVAINVKVVLGVTLARRSQHPFFNNRRMMAVDSSGSGLDPGYDDLNGRVVVVIHSTEDFNYVPSSL